MSLESDRLARQTIAENFGPNILVEASAGSGKTTSLVTRLVQGLLQGAFGTDQVAVVTFTKKAAEELTLRVRLELETKSEMAQARQALDSFDQLFIGTVHSFCAQLLRLFPLAAGIAPGFEELEDDEDSIIQHQALNQVLQTDQGLEVRHLLSDLSAHPKDLEATLSDMVGHNELDYPIESRTEPDIETVWKETETFLAQVQARLPESPELRPSCELLARLQKMRQRFERVGSHEPRSIIKILLLLDKEQFDVTKLYWGKTRQEQNDRLDSMRQLVQDFQTRVLRPHLQEWREYLYTQLIPLLLQARELSGQLRKNRGLVNFHDLQMRACQMLAEHPPIAQRASQRYRYLLVDEFQDTDPLQAELFFRLAQAEFDGHRPWKDLKLRTGALFLVGDPKQSIYRFRRADMEIYQGVRQAILQQGGLLLQLQATYRAIPEICAPLNQAFSQLFSEQAGIEQIPYVPLLSQRPPSPTQLAPIVKLTTTANQTNLVSLEAQAIAKICRSAPRGCQILILTPRKKPVLEYARAVLSQGLSCQASVENTPLSQRGLALIDLLLWLKDPYQQPLQVGILRGILFGHSDPELFEHFGLGQKGGVQQTLDLLHQIRKSTQHLSPGAWVQEVSERIGLWLLDPEETTNIAAYLSQRCQAGDPIAPVLEEILKEKQVPVLISDSIQPGTDQVHVRIMNLHKAKGLEADWVLLASPHEGLGGAIDHTTDQAGAYARIRSNRKPLAHPARWDALEQLEQDRLLAEKLRLLYVAGTRARQRLIIGQAIHPEGKSFEQPSWEPLLRALGPVAEIEDLPEFPAAPQSQPSSAVSQWRQERSQRQTQLEQLQRPSWTRLTVTTQAHHGQIQGTLRRQGPAGAAWGQLLHRLLEAVARQPELTTAKIFCLARWFSHEEEELQEFLHEAVEQVEKVRASEFWQQVLAAQERLVEVPFGHLIGSTATFGVIDLALRQEEGWDLVDYKSDQKTLPELVASYADQVADYAHSWTELSKQEVHSATLFGLYALEQSQDLQSGPNYLPTRQL